MNVRKIINFKNLKKLLRKIYHKYMSKEQEEYNEIGNVVRANFKRLFQRFLLGGFYKEPSEEKYIFFPLHVPSDTQLLIRCPMFQFQEAFIEYLSINIPVGYKLYIKEHPAAVGGYNNDLIKGRYKKT